MLCDARQHSRAYLVTLVKREDEISPPPGDSVCDVSRYAASQSNRFEAGRREQNWLLCLASCSCSPERNRGHVRCSFAFLDLVGQNPECQRLNVRDSLFLRRAVYERTWYLVNLGDPAAILL